jgi:MFS family permease
VAVFAVFLVHGFLFASWTAHIPDVKEHLHLDDGALGVALLGAPIGSVLAMVLAARIVPRRGSRRVVRVVLVGYCLTGPLVGLTNSVPAFFVAFMTWGAFQGALDVAMNTQALAVEGSSGRRLMAGFHGSWSLGSLLGAGVGAIGVGIGWSLSEQLLLFAAPCLFGAGWLTTRMMQDPPAPPRASPHMVGDRGGVLQRAVVVLGTIAFVDMLCEGAVADWAAVYLRGSLHAIAAIAGLGYAMYLLVMMAVRLSGNRIMAWLPPQILLPFLAVVAIIGFVCGLTINRQVSVLVGFGSLGAGLALVVPTVLSACGNIRNVPAGKAVATVSACGWSGFVLGPPLIGGLASLTSLRTALFLLPVLIGIIAAATATTRVLRDE